MSDLLTDLAEFVQTLKVVTERFDPDDDFPEGHESSNWYTPDRNWWVALTEDLPFADFNKEVCEPRLFESDPEGYVGIRVDDDFFFVAKIPYKFKDLSMEQIGKMLWPDVEDAEYNEEVTILKNKIGITIVE